MQLVKKPETQKTKVCEGDVGKCCLEVMVLNLSLSTLRDMTVKIMQIYALIYVTCVTAEASRLGFPCKECGELKKNYRKQHTVTGLLILTHGHDTLIANTLVLFVNAGLLL